MATTYIETLATRRSFPIEVSALADMAKGGYYIDPAAPGTISLCTVAATTIVDRVLGATQKDLGVKIIDKDTGMEFYWTGAAWTFNPNKHTAVEILAVPVGGPGTYNIAPGTPATINAVAGNGANELDASVALASANEGVQIHDSITDKTLTWDGSAWRMPNEMFFSGDLDAAAKNGTLGVISVDMMVDEAEIYLCVEAAATWWNIRSLQNDEKDKQVSFSSQADNEDYYWDGTQWVLKSTSPVYDVDADLGLVVPY